MNSSLLRMGVVGRPHGIKGEVSAIWDGDAQPVAGMPVQLRLNGVAKSSEIVASRTHKDRQILSLSGVGDRTSAENLKGAEIFVAREYLPELEEDEAYLQDLTGFEVVLENGEVLGILDHIEFPANQTVWAIKSAEGNEILFPARPEFIVAFDMSGHKISINPPEGLVDIYRA